MNHSDFPMIVRDIDAGGFTWVNRPFINQLGWTADALKEKPLLEWIASSTQAAFSSALASGHATVRANHRCQDGGEIALDWELRTEGDHIFALGLHAEHSRRPVAQQRETGGGSDDQLSETLTAMALILEDQHPGRRCSILLTGEGGSIRVGAGPSLPAEYNAAVESLTIGPSLGSCGTAAYWNRRVFVEDIQQESLWRDIKDYAARAGVAACWSYPITSRTGDVLGAMALYNSVPSAPSQYEIQGLALAAKMVGLAIERGRAEEALRKSEADAQFHARVLSAVSKIMTAYVGRNALEEAARDFLSSAIELTGSQGGVLRILEEDMVPSVIRLGDIDAEAPAEFIEQIGATKTPIVQQSESGQVCLADSIRVDGQARAVIWVSSSRDFRDRDVSVMSVLTQAASVLFDAHIRKCQEAVLEERLRQSAKMEAIGVLAGGVAHDFNNMLSAVLGNAELALKQDCPPTIGTKLRRIIDASISSSELCHQLLAYAGRGMRTLRRFNCNSLVRELSELQRVVISKKATLTYHLSEQAVLVEGDRAQLNQIVMNFITNASEAVGDDIGSIEVRTSVGNYSQHTLNRFQGGQGLEPGRYVEISVSDTGCGMTPEAQSRIFDPFYTTKLTGRGLGLAAVLGIVRAHHGAIRLQSHPGVGTTFTVLLPCASDQEEESAPQCTNSSPQSACILVVDDEADVREVHADVLRHGGYTVLTAVDGRDGLEIFSQKQAQIDCVLLDYSMPQLNGEETFRELRKLSPSLPVILVSGYTEHEMLERFSAAGISGVVQKPVAIDRLLEKVCAALA